MDPEALEGLLDLLEHLRDGVAFERGQIDEVGALIAILGRLLSSADRLHGRPEPVHLRTGVVVVVLALDGMARVRQHPRERVAVRAVRGRDRDRAGRVRRDHLDLDSLNGVGKAGAIPLSGLEDLRERLPIPGRREPEVDETRARHLGADDSVKADRLFGQLLGDLARRALPLGCKLESGVRRVVPVLGARWPLELDRGAGDADELLGQLGDGTIHAYIVGAWKTKPSSDSSTSTSTPT